MIINPRIAVILTAHAIVAGAALWLIGTSTLPLSMRLVGGVVAAAVLLPWLQSLAAQRLERITLLSLLLVLVIGIGVVEVLASGAQLATTILLGAAMLEFAVLLTLARNRPPASNEPARR